MIDPLDSTAIDAGVTRWSLIFAFLLQLWHSESEMSIAPSGYAQPQLSPLTSDIKRDPSRSGDAI